MTWKERTAAFLMAVLLYIPSSNEKWRLFITIRFMNKSLCKKPGFYACRGKFSEAPPPLFIKPDLNGCPDVNQISKRIKAATGAGQEPSEELQTPISKQNNIRT